MLIWDVTCPDTLAPSHLSVATREAGAVATEAEFRKKLKYADLSCMNIFVPIAVETLEAFGMEAPRFFKEPA